MGRSSLTPPQGTLSRFLYGQPHSRDDTETVYGVGRSCPGKEGLSEFNFSPGGPDGRT